MWTELPTSSAWLVIRGNVLIAELRFSKVTTAISFGWAMGFPIMEGNFEIRIQPLGVTDSLLDTVSWKKRILISWPYLQWCYDGPDSVPAFPQRSPVLLIEQAVAGGEDVTGRDEGSPAEMIPFLLKQHHVRPSGTVRNNGSSYDESSGIRVGIPICVALYVCSRGAYHLKKGNECRYSY